jgi:hypothetical protein
MEKFRQTTERGEHFVAKPNNKVSHGVTEFLGVDRFQFDDKISVYISFDGRRPHIVVHSALLRNFSANW